MASAKIGGDDHLIFIYDPRYPVNWYKFGLLERFFHLIVLYADEYFLHLACDQPAYRAYDGNTVFNTLDKIALSDSMQE